jgi:DNA-binding transcriptional LysR family regulator
MNSTPSSAPTDPIPRGRRADRYSLRQLRYFLAVARTLSVSKAAHAFHVSQPTVSHSVQMLEEEFGVPLFVRRGSHLSLTPAGASFAPAAERLLGELQLSVDQARTCGQQPARNLRIGLNGSVLCTQFSSILTSFLDIHADPSWSVREDSSDVLHAALVSGEIDIALWRSPMPAARLKAGGIDEALLFAEPLVALVAHDSRLAHAGVADLADLGDECLLTLAEPQSAFARRLRQDAEAAGFRIRVREAEVSAPSLIALAAAGLGAALMPAGVAGVNWPGVAAVPLRPALFDVPVYAAIGPHAPEAACLLRQHAIAHSRAQAPEN